MKALMQEINSDILTFPVMNYLPYDINMCEILVKGNILLIFYSGVHFFFGIV